MYHPLHGDGLCGRGGFSRAGAAGSRPSATADAVVASPRTIDERLEPSGQWPAAIGGRAGPIAPSVRHAEELQSGDSDAGRQ